ncbi:MAG TPA: hypothetical protein VF060_20530 [Trebonia sp.]
MNSENPAHSDGSHGIEGYRVRTGDFTTESVATSLATTLKELGFTTAAVEWTGCDRDQAPDSEAIHAVARAQVVTAAAQELGAGSPWSPRPPGRCTPAWREPRRSACCPAA